jgi:spoIIIJ-associated protein
MKPGPLPYPEANGHPRPAMKPNHPSLDRGQTWLQDILKLSALEVSVSAEIQDHFAEHSCWLTIDRTNLSDAQVSALIGPEGKALDALQYLANVTLNLTAEEADRGAYTIEIDGYRQRRLTILKEMAQTAAEAVRSTQKPYEMPAISAAERRQIHSILSLEADLSTFSRGEEPDRRLIVKPAATKVIGAVQNNPETV